MVPSARFSSSAMVPGLLRNISSFIDSRAGGPRPAELVGERDGGPSNMKLSNEAHVPARPPSAGRLTCTSTCTIYSMYCTRF